MEQICTRHGEYVVNVVNDEEWFLLNGVRKVCHIISNIQQQVQLGAL